MIQFHLTKDAAKDLAAHLEEPLAENSSAMQWYLHRVTVARRKCIIALELNSRYAMAFCGLTKIDFERFPEIFAEAFINHAMMSLLGDYQFTQEQEMQFVNSAAMIASEQSFQRGHNRSVTAHINDVVELLRILVEDNHYPLPVDSRDAALFSIRANETLRKTKNDPDYFRPCEEFQAFWLGLLEHAFGIIPRSAHSADDVNAEQADNVIKVDFRRNTR